MTFVELGLSPSLARTVADLGYATPRPVQVEAIPAVLAGGDVCIRSETGSGKTAAFVLPIVEMFARRAMASSLEQAGLRAPRALILVPTRELAQQIFINVRRYARNQSFRIKTCILIGGVSENPQMMTLRGGVDLVVATPGRLLDLVRSRALTLDTVETLVLDEADRLLSLGFGDEVAIVRTLLPKQLQTLLVSATFPASVKHLAAAMLHNPTQIDVNVDEPSLPPTLVQRAIETDVATRTPLLCHLIKTLTWPQTLVFVASRYGADHVVEKLAKARITAAALHGDLSQGRRGQALEDFKNRTISVLVATDVAGRGLDIVNLPVVVNYDLPRSPVDYLHRVGRTARAGEVGLAVNLLTIDNDAHFALIERRHQFVVDREQLAGFERTQFASPTADPHGGVKGKRPNKKDKLRAAGKR
jgi:ATP-dependent RNA helicase RhlE